jgi:hypothetical protein
MCQAFWWDIDKTRMQESRGQENLGKAGSACILLQVERMECGKTSGQAKRV